MPPQKRSIRDFFAPVQKDAPTIKQPAPKIAAIPRGTSSTASKTNSNVFARNSSPPLSSLPPQNPAIGDTIRVDTSRTTAPDDGPPSTSQSSANSAGISRRIVSNGEPVVLNSDSDTDDLPEFDFGQPTTLSKPMAPVTKIKPRDEAKKNGLRKPPPKRKEGSSFSLFIQTAEKGAETERKIAEGKANLDKPLVEDMLLAEFEMSEKALADAVHDEEDPEKGKRLCLAMQRTSALHSECVFNFFGENRDGSALRDLPFPMESLSNQRWTSSFEEQPTRDQAFLSGFAERVFRYQQLPDELAAWMIDQVCICRNDVLNDKYIQLLNANHHPLQTLLNKARLDSLFIDLGADLQCLNPLQETTPSYESHPAPKRPVPTSLVWVCRLLQTAAPKLQMEANSHAFYILLHLCMDHSVNSDIDTLHAVQDAIEAVMCSLTYDRKLASLLNNVVPLLLKRIRHPVLQRTLVRSLPAKSPLAAYFQRYLALSFLLHPKILDTALDKPEVPRWIHAYLEDSQDFRVTKETKYMSLAARLTLLDVAVGPGLLTVPYYPLTNPTTSREGSSPITAPGPQSSEEKAFNNEVEALAQRIKLLSNSIIETGVLSDLSRLEAKDCSERLYHRLENAVRIGGKKLVDIFGDSEQINGTKKMYQWLGQKGKSRSHTSVPNEGNSTVAGMSISNSKFEPLEPGDGPT